MTPKTQAKVFADADNNGANARLLTTAPADTSFPLARASAWAETPSCH